MALGKFWHCTWTWLHFSLLLQGCLTVHAGQTENQPRPKQFCPVLKCWAHLYPEFGLHIEHDDAVAAIFYANETSVHVTKIEGDSAYKDVMRPGAAPAPSATLPSFSISERFGLCWMASQYLSEEALKSMGCIGSPKEAYLGTPFVWRRSQLRDWVSEHQKYGLAETLHSIGIRKATEQSNPQGIIFRADLVARVAGCAEWPYIHHDSPWFDIKPARGCDRRSSLYECEYFVGTEA